jgi:hypothetical protein
VRSNPALIKKISSRYQISNIKSITHTFTKGFEGTSGAMQKYRFYDGSSNEDILNKD